MSFEKVEMKIEVLIFFGTMRLASLTRKEALNDIYSFSLEGRRSG
jgi:hypothetical protein